MNANRLAPSIALACALTSSPSASATYLGLGVRLHTTVVVSGTSRSVWRVYALFNNPNDYLTAIAGSDLIGNLRIESRNATDTGVGSEFFNAGNSNTAPHFDNGVFSPPEAQWDTFATIGVDANVDSTDHTATSLPFPAFIVGTSLSSNNIAWYSPLGEQGRAGGRNGLLQSVWYNGPNPVAGSNGAYGMLLTQLTVNAGDNVRGTMSVTGVKAGAPASTFTSNGQTFSSVPGPGVFGVVVIAAVATSGRRSREAARGGS